MINMKPKQTIPLLVPEALEQFLSRKSYGITEKVDSDWFDKNKNFYISQGNKK